MIAMQYRFRLPAAYDMGIITRRIQDSGPLLDGFPGLLLKAYCYAGDSADRPAAEPLYAPFYLWQDSDSMTRFLTSSGFRRLTQDFGWPQIDSWLVLDYQPSKALPNSVFARRLIKPIAPYSNLMQSCCKSEIPPHHTSQILAWDVRSWQHLTFQLSPLPFKDHHATESYRVGHLSLPHNIL